MDSPGSLVLRALRRTLPFTAPVAPAILQAWDGGAPQWAAEAALRQLGVGPLGGQPSASRRANGRFMASSAERTAATARSPRESAEPT